MTRAEPSVAGNARLAAILGSPGVAHILALLNDAGEEARVVGGAVRNALLGLPVADIDIATTSLPDDVILRARAAGIHVVPTGYEHGTVTLVFGGVPHEVTTLREDVETDGRRAVVRYGRSFAADAFRRDFTMNALSAGPDGRIHDYASGLDDIAARRVRFIGDADQRIREDYLRILRFFRFSAAYGDGTLDTEGLAATLRHCEGLDLLSRERIRQETMKLLVAPHAAGILQEIGYGAILPRVLDGPADLPRFAAMVALEQRFALDPDALRRLMALALRTPADIERLRDALRLTNREATRMEAVMAEPLWDHAEGAAAAPDRSATERLIYRLGAEGAGDVLMLHAAATGVDAAAGMRLVREWTPPRFLLTGKDVIARGIGKGPEVGRLLAVTEAAWLDAGMPSDEPAQRAILASVVG